MNLIEWLGDNPWALWLTLAVLLGIAELLTLDLVLIMLASGALAGMLVALALPGLWWLQIAVAIGVSVATLALLRPTLLAKVRSLPGYRSSTAKMVGSSGVATAEITRDAGEVKVDGQSWSARSYQPDQVIAAGTEIEVFELDGAIVRVYPKHDALP